MAITARAARLRLASDVLGQHADAVAAEIAPVAARIDNLVAGLPGPVQKSASFAQLSMWTWNRSRVACIHPMVRSMASFRIRA